MPFSIIHKDLPSAFYASFGRNAALCFSVPGRVELGGNHTDHQLGLVMAASVDCDTRAAAASNADGHVRVLSERYPLIDIDISDSRFTVPREEEKASPAALVRGVLAALSVYGTPSGFDAVITTDVLPGSGLSSSASFEVLIAAMADRFSGTGLSPVQLAQAAQKAENLYFGKPCGLMDQIACATGGAVMIDFEDITSPAVTPVLYDFSKSGHAVCIVDCGADHADLTDEYAAVPQELAAVCSVFGKKKLREVPEEDFLKHFQDVRVFAGDRAAVRAIHVYRENRRVLQMADALSENDFPRFLSFVTASGRSSAEYLQNITPAGQTRRQALCCTLALMEETLGGRGAFRVHGGGFAGTALAFVPEDMLSAFVQTMDDSLFPGACKVLRIRADGIRVTGA